MRDNGLIYGCLVGGFVGLGLWLYDYVKSRKTNDGLRDQKKETSDQNENNGGIPTG